MSDLLERLEKATGRDSRLDYDITKKFWPEGVRVLLADTYPGGKSAAGQPVTASIDAALALAERVLPGCHWMVSSPRRGAGFEGVIVLPKPVYSVYPAQHPVNGPIALCIAVLKAHEASTTFHISRKGQG